MTIRDRAYNVIKKLGKAWFADYCDVQIAIEDAIRAERDDFRDALAKLQQLKPEDAQAYLETLIENLDKGK